MGSFTSLWQNLSEGGVVNELVYNTLHEGLSHQYT